jgi:hypothetical protein
MKMVRASLLMGGLFAAMTGLTLWLGAPKAQAQDKPVTHPLRMAETELKEARKELEKAPSKFGGHKEEAIEDIDHALKHLERLTGWVRTHHKEEWEQEHKDEARAVEKGEKYPRLHAALHELRRAHKYLKESKEEFGDNKQKELALRDLDKAINQLDRILTWVKENEK